MLTDLQCQNSGWLWVFLTTYSTLYGRYSKLRSSSATQNTCIAISFSEFSRKSSEKYYTKRKFWLQTHYQDHYNLPEAF